MFEGRGRHVHARRHARTAARSSPSTSASAGSVRTRT